MDVQALQRISLHVAGVCSVENVLAKIVAGLEPVEGCALVRIWLIGPGDICEACHRRPECPDQTRCLHLKASAGRSAVDPGLVWTSIDGRFRRFPLNVRKVGRVGATGEAETADPVADQVTADAAVEPPASVNLIVVADLDFISEQFFSIRAVAPANLNFDNVTFFLNAMDILLGDEAFIDLRSRRARHRTLEQVEAQTRTFIEQRTREEQQAEEDADLALEDAQDRLDARIQEVQDRDDIDAQAKEIMARHLQEGERRVLGGMAANREAQKEPTIPAGRESMGAQFQRIHSTIGPCAVVRPPIPVFVLGVWIFARRQKREREGAAAARRLRE